MPRKAPDPDPDPTPRQRWIAAQRLAAADPPVLAAAMAGIALERLEGLVRDDPGFQALLAACGAVHALPDAAWRERLHGLVREATERAVVDGRLGPLNLCLRTGGLLAEAEPEEEMDELEAFFAGLTPEQLAEYEALGRRGPAAADAAGPEDEAEEAGEEEDEAAGAAPVLPFRPPRPRGGRPGLPARSGPGEAAVLRLRPVPDPLPDPPASA